METWSVVLALAAVALSVYYYFKRRYAYFEKHGIPYKRSLPVLGNTWKAVVRGETFADSIKNLYNFNPDAKYIGFYEFTKPNILVRDIELAKQIMVKHFEHFQDHRSFQSDEMGELFNKNLFGLRGERWKEVRNAFTPVFTSSKMKAMFKLMCECAERYGDTLANLPEKERVLDLKEVLSRYTNDTIATCAFGITLDSMADPKNQFYVYGRVATNFTSWTIVKFLIGQHIPWLSKILGLRIISREIENFYKEVVTNTIKTRQETDIYRPDLIQTLLEVNNKLTSGKEFTIDDMTANALIFFSGGLENISNLLCFAAFEAVVNKGVQEKLQNEIDEVLERCNGKVTYDAINDMKYLNGVVHEALRMYPAAIMTDRVCTKRFELPPALPGSKPFVVEEGTCLQIPIFAIQRDPQYYDNPNKFDPDRYDGNFRNVQNSATFLSFGQGPRVCIANRFAMLEAKVMLFHMFAKCTLKPCSKTVAPIKLKKSAVMYAEGGFWLELVPREKSRMVFTESVSGGGVLA